MKISFNYTNGNSQLILLPENSREQLQINLFRENAGEIKIATPPSTPEGLMFITDNYETRLKPSNK